MELFVDDTSFSKWEVDQGFFDVRFRGSCALARVDSSTASPA